MEFIKKEFSGHCSTNTIKLLIWMLIIFFIILTISTAVGIQNKIKEGRYIGQEVETKNTITVSGQGEVYAKPDLALTSFSVQTESNTVAQAMSINTKNMNGVIEAMKKAGVREEDLKTTNFNIYPLYDYLRESSIYPSGKRVLRGYEIIQSLQVKIRDLDKVGQIIQAATEAGANQVGNLQFTIDQAEELEEQARAEAIEEAKDKAEELADQLGVDLVRIIGFNEGVQSARFYAMEQTAYSMDGGGGITPDIETGENKVEILVNITYEIN